MDATRRILNALGDRYPQDRAFIASALEVFGNADRVLRVMELDGSINEPQVGYTVWPTIKHTGDRTPEQYVADRKAAADAFEADRWDYFERFRAAKTEKAREQIVSEQARKWGP